MRSNIWLAAAILGAFGLTDRTQTPAAKDPVQAVEFKPAADARLTDDQIRMYITVRRAARSFTKDVNPSAPPADIAAQVAAGANSELSAARRLGVNPAEYRWVRARIVEAMPGAARPGDAALLAMIDAQVKAGGAQIQSKTAESQDGGRAPQPASEAAIAHNRALLKKYQRELDELGKSK